MKDKSKDFSGFEARVFQHEMDHILGYHILDWNISFGDVEFVPDPKKDFKNFEKVKRFI